MWSTRLQQRRTRPCGKLNFYSVVPRCVSAIKLRRGARPRTSQFVTINWLVRGLDSARSAYSTTTLPVIFG
jgi:hypothetical protein